MRQYVPRPYKTKRDTARGIMVKDGCLLLIERSRPGLYYYSTPGGGIETGETPEQAIEREMQEETCLEFRLERKVFEWHEGLHIHHFFLCTYIAGEPHLQDDAEENHNGPQNVHKPTWVKFEDLDDCMFGYWEPIKDVILDGAINGFTGKAKIITTKAVV